jgi:hypothetical protein
MTETSTGDTPVGSPPRAGTVSIDDGTTDHPGVHDRCEFEEHEGSGSLSKRLDATPIPLLNGVEGGPISPNYGTSSRRDSDSLDDYEAMFFKQLLRLIMGAKGRGETTTGSSRDSISRIVILSRKLSDGVSSAALYRQAYFAACLAEDPRNHRTTDNILVDLEYATSTNSPIYTVMRGLLWSDTVITMLLGGLIIVSSFVYSWSSKLPWKDVIVGPYFDLLQSPPIVAAALGVLGGTVSVLLRLSEFEGATRRSRQFLFMTGIMLPLVGAVFALVTCALFASKLINFSFAGGDGAVHTPYFYMVIGFLSGFSERFTRGLLGSAEHTIAVSEKQEAEVESTTNGSQVTRSTTISLEHQP